MATEVVTTGTVNRGRLKVRITPAFQSELQSFRDGPVTVRIERKRATRRQQANAYYWVAVIATLAEYTGYSPDDMHDVLKAKFLPKTLAMANGNGEVMAEFVIGGSTTKLDVVEFYEYVQRIKQWAQDDLNCIIPEPTTDAQ
jgi:hypothetical protein